MGLWDVFDYAVKEPVTKAYQYCTTNDLGRVAVSKAIDDIPTVTKSVLTSSYALGCAAVSKIDENVRNDGVVKQKVEEYLPAPESREKIVQALTHPVTMEAIKFVAPGGAQTAYNIVGSILMGKNENQLADDEHNQYEHVIQQFKVLQAENEKMQKDMKELNQLVMSTTNNSSSSSSTVSEQKPEEVIIEFMTKGLNIKDLLDKHPVVVPIRGSFEILESSN